MTTKEKKANKKIKELIKSLCKYHNLDKNSELVGDIEHILIILRNEIL